MKNGHGNKPFVADDGTHSSEAAADRSQRNDTNTNNAHAVNANPTDASDYRVRVSGRFVVLSLLSCTLLAFAVGRTARQLLITIPQRRVAELQSSLLLQHQLDLSLASGHSGSTKDVMRLPNPVLKNKPVPETIYTSMNFDTARSSSINSRWVVVEKTPRDRNDPADETCDNPAAAGGNQAEVLVDGNDEVDDELHLPAGQHLLMDIRGVQSSFLASEERLAQAMLDVVNDCGLTLLSYHCHGLQPAGVSCVGVLLESHVSFHTWPSNGVITLDLFTCGAQSLLPIVNKTEQVFGIPADVNGDPPEVRWAYKVRGFGDETEEELTDLFTFPIGAMTEYKKELLSKRTKWYRVDIYDVLRPQFQTYEHYRKSLREDRDSYESQYPELFAPDRILFVDGVLQTRRSAEIPYHEALVHPGMFAHSDPVNVLLLNVGGGAALREVLKHTTVEHVTVVDEHEEVFQISKEFFPEFHDCSFIVNATSEKCYDDSRVQIIIADLFDWVVEEYDDDDDGAGRQTTPSLVDSYDVVILDDLYYIDGQAEDGDFMWHLSQLMSPNAVFVASMGEAPSIRSPSPKHSEMKDGYEYVKSLADYGFKSVVDYEEGHLGFSWPWQFVVAFRDYKEARTEWFANGAWLDLKIATRTYPTIDGEPELLHFDGAVMQSYSHPSRASEVVFCRANPNSFYCKDGHGFDPERPNIPDSMLEVKRSSTGENVGRGVFIKKDIPEYSYIALDQVVHPVHIQPGTVNVVRKMVHELEDGGFYSGQIVLDYANFYGHAMSHHGGDEYFVDSNFLCFLNHGCNGTHNLSYNVTVTELTANDEIVPEEILWHQRRVGDEYNPAAERHPETMIHAVPLRDLQAGEELFINYLGVAGGVWASYIPELLRQCEGGIGEVLEYEGN